VNPKRFGAHDILKPGISRVTSHIYLTLSNPATLFKKSGVRIQECAARTPARTEDDVMVFFDA
jgi:hypothetical protein